jgi:CBS domain containing-hemolysin-like protein
VVGLEWIIVLLMVLINALFAAYEIALASVTKTRLESLKDQGRF